PMVLQEEQTADVTAEKHVPFIEKIDGGFKVRIGQNAAHPMEEKHFIEWIELLTDGKAYRQFLKPGDAPEATFACGQAAGAAVREYCNIHGLWKN
ncbi:MAG: desulfoferrodoxin, partial [Phycisphaerae bacterium]|nr:desulfoferrodoxin [Phycisphaerae bacterium]